MGSDNTETSGRSLELGVTKPWYEDEAPAHLVNLSGFYMDRYEVTYEEMAVFVQEANYPLPTSWKRGTYLPGKGRFPVTDVTWFQAEAYCHWVG